MRTLTCGLLLICTLLALTSCESPYIQNGFLGGYTDSRTSANTATITFRGNYFTSGYTAQTYALYRAAQITLEAGFDYFVVTNGNAIPARNAQLNAPTRDLHSAVIFIKMYQGVRPTWLPNSFDARDVVAHLGPKAFLD